MAIYHLLLYWWGSWSYLRLVHVRITNAMKRVAMRVPGKNNYDFPTIINQMGKNIIILFFLRLFNNNTRLNEHTNQDIFDDVS